jgi:hypothetical protein
MCITDRQETKPMPGGRACLPRFREGRLVSLLAITSRAVRETKPIRSVRAWRVRLAARNDSRGVVQTKPTALPGGWRARPALQAGV